MKKLNVYLLLAFYSTILGFGQYLMAQPTWTNNDYKKVLWMTTRFYGGQRSGSENWLLHNHLPAGVDPSLRGLGHRADRNIANNVDLSGGWNDCGDHVKFGQTQFYSAYLLIKGFAEFKEGYDDRYAYNYNGYKTSGQWNFEGTGHHPNCIPDLLDEMKHETDFLIKCTPNSSTFWFQVGNGGGSADHCERVTAVRMQTYAVNCGGNNDNGTPGGRRPSCNNPNDGMMASLAAAALAVMAREYLPYDAAYAALCLTHAQNAYTYASTRLGNTVGSCFGGFYSAPAVVNNTNAYVCAATELFATTGTGSYLTTANGLFGTVAFNGGWSFDYANIGELALYCLAENGHAAATTAFNNRITGHFMAAGSRNGNGVYTAHGTWGRLRYNGNAAFLISLFSRLNNNVTAPVINAIHNDVDYIMGRNSNNRTYIVGFAPATGTFITPLNPHHRNVFLNDDNVGTAINLPLPAKNVQMGALVGGQRDGTFVDSWNDYVNTEVCIDYNAGLVGALGFINARLAPVVISCGGNACRQPNLGPNLSTCSITLPTLLNANAGAPGGVISYRWYTWNGTTKTLIAAQTGLTYSANAIGGYIVERDSAYTGGPCTKSDTITISNSFPTPMITGPLNICNPASYNLTPTNAASFPGGTTFQWAVDYAGGTSYSALTGEVSSTLSAVRRAGRYRITATAGACSNNGNVVITSELPIPVDGCSPTTGSVALSITNNVGTNYNWYILPTSGSPIAGGTGTISVNSPSIATTTMYYVQDMNSVNATVGPYFSGTPTTYGSGANVSADPAVQTRFQAIGNYSITRIFIPYMLYGAGEVGKRASFEITNDGGTVISTSPQYTGQLASGSYGASGVYIIRFDVAIPIVGGTLATPTTLRIRLTASGNDSNPYLFNDNADPFDGSIPLNFNYVDNQGGNTMRIIGSNIYNSNSTTRYAFFIGFNISAGASCARLPVMARIGGCTTAPIVLANFTAEKSNGRTILNWVTASEVNNDYFNIERSTDGKNFEVIGKIDGNGFSNGATNYSFADEEFHYGSVYYRLVQYDFDGQNSISTVLVVNYGTDLTLTVAPNPFIGSTEVLVNTPSPLMLSMRITDIAGLELFQGSIVSNQSHRVGENLAPGVYIIQVQLDDQLKTTRIIKQ